MASQQCQQGAVRSKAATILQKWVRGKQSRMKTFQIAKQAQYRHRVLQQIMETEQNYIRDLGYITADFKMKLLSEKAISASESETIFSNVEQIRKLNEQFYASIFQNYQNYTHYKCVFQQAHKFVFFFKIYFEYFNNFPNACALIEQLKKTRCEFREIIEQLTHVKKFRNLNLQDYIIKPIQRLPKYVILFKQLKKRTPTHHPDYTNICQLLDSFQMVNTSNNQKLNKLINNYKLAEIQQLLGIRDLAIPGVDFIGQQPVTAFTYDNKIVDAILYLFNNQFILRKARTNKILSRVKLSHGASIIEDENQLYYKNIITIQNHQGDSFTLLCINSEQKQLLFNKLSYLIFSAQKNTIDKALVLFKNNGISDSFVKKLNLMELMPQVTVLGTAEREAKIFKYTVYIIEIKIKNVKQKIFVRFSEILQIQKVIQTQFPQLEIKQNLLATTWFLNHKPRTIEHRKMNIQRFLKQILSKEEIMSKGHMILFKLGLPFDFYDLPRKFKENYEQIRSSILQKSQSSHSKSQKPNKSIMNRRYSVFSNLDEQEEGQVVENTININDLLKANENQLGHFTRFSEITDLEKMEMNIPNIQLIIYVPWVQNFQGYKTINIQMKSYQRVQLLICLVARKIGLTYFKDFRLFLERSYSQRVLDDDEIICKVEQEMRSGQYRLILKKMIFVSRDTQIRQIKKDVIRLKLIASQTIYDVLRGRYALDYKNYLIFAVLVGIILSLSYRSIKNIEKVVKKLVVPQQILVDEIEQWDNDYRILYEQLLKKLKSIEQANKRILQENKRDDIFADLNTLAHFSIYNQLQQNILYGTYPFMVQLSSQFHAHIIKIHQIQQTNRNVFLAIKHASILIVSMCMSIVYFEFQHHQVVKTETFPGSIVISLKNGIQVKLKTNSSYFVRQLLVYYKNYRTVWERLVHDSIYRQSIAQSSQKQNIQIQNLMIQ